MIKTCLVVAQRPAAVRSYPPPSARGARAGRPPRTGSGGLLPLLALFLVLSGCDLPHFHAHEGPAGHSHGEEHVHGDGHGHDPGAIAVTHFTEPHRAVRRVSAAGRSGRNPASPPISTRLDDFRPVAEGRSPCDSSGGGCRRRSSASMGHSVPGIFRPVAQPAYAGERTVSLTLESSGLTDRRTTWGPTASTRTPRAPRPPSPPRRRPGTRSASSRSSSGRWISPPPRSSGAPSTPRSRPPASIKARKDGEAVVGAPTAGHLLASDAFPRIGTRVSAGQPLATILPRVAGDQVDVASLELAVERARSEHQFAEREHGRLETLVAQRAASQRDLNEAENQERVAKAELAPRPSGSPATGAPWAARAPTRAPGSRCVRPSPAPWPRSWSPPAATWRKGTRCSTSSTPIACGSRRAWPRRTSAGCRTRRGPGSRSRVSIEPSRSIRKRAARSSPSETSSIPCDVPYPWCSSCPIPMACCGSACSPRCGSATGESADDLAIPVSAVVDEAGQDVVYVMLGGESFERRVVRLGIRDGDYVQVDRGLAGRGAGRDPRGLPGATRGCVPGRGRPRPRALRAMP